MSPAFEILDWDDTPRYYDMVFDEDTNKEADLLEGLARRHWRARLAARARMESNAYLARTC